MSYLTPINANIEPIWKASKGAICLYDNDNNQITSRKFQCIYCSEIRKIEALHRLCGHCDRDALHSNTDHAYECPFGLREGVIHVPLKNGVMHAILGKCRPESNERAVKKLREIISHGASLNFDRMMQAYEEVPFLERDTFNDHLHTLKTTLLTLRNEEWLDSFGNETILRTIRVMRRLGPIRCFDLYPLLYWSESTIKRAFQNTCKERFSDFIRERKLVWAEDLLTNSDDSIMEIAKQLNYDYMYFQTLFKKSLLHITERFSATRVRWRSSSPSPLLIETFIVRAALVM